ncbi:MAG: hypothetical protein OXG85_04655 [Chloroflexi bacterium]|nr:hypothetical protein [Chloroflexota bacterium]
MRRILIVTLVFIRAISLSAQDIAQPELRLQSWDVFVKRSAESPLPADLIFVNLLTGAQTAISANGERFSLTQGGVIYFDLDNRQVKLAKADGIIREHPFINAARDTHSVDWIISNDKRRLAWSIVRKIEDDQRITAIWLTDAAGAEVRELLVYGPREGLQLRPVAFGADYSQLFVEVYADDSESFSPYLRRSGLFALSIGEGEVTARNLPGDQTCFCPVGFGAGSMLWLAPSQALTGLDVEIFNLESGVSQLVPALARGNYRDAGNILVSADGKQAVYALSQVRNFASDHAEIRTVVVQVDLENGLQRIASRPIADLVRPLHFTENDRAVIVTLEGSDRTLKVDLQDGRLIDLAEATYLGRLDDH